MILDMHCHTAEHSLCSHVSADELVQANFDKGLEGTVLTDHHYLWTPEEMLALRSRLKVPDYYVILSGQEVETPELHHVLVYGATVSFERGTTLREIRERFPRAAVIWAHPYRDQNIPALEKLRHPLIDGVEMFSTNHTVLENSRALRDWHQYKFTALSGTDAHAASYAGLYPTFFDHPVSTEEELAVELKAGRCRPFFKEISRSGTSSTRVTQIVIGTKGSAGAPPDTFVIRAHKNADKWRQSARSMEIMKEIGRRGFDTGRFRVPKQLGHDPNSLTVIEQGIQGMTLFDTLVKSGREEARACLQMAAEWLARLHNLKLQITPSEDFLNVEQNSLPFYLSAFHESNHPHKRPAAEITNAVLEIERLLYRDHPERLVQGHGDYHPKNIFIGRDNEEDPASVFVAAIDFNSSNTMPPAFDVGTFLAQFRNQFYGNREVLSKVWEEIFLDAYLQLRTDLDTDFLSQVELFKARTAMSICYLLIKIGLGESENLWRVLVEAGRILTHLQVKSMGTISRIERTGEKRKSA